MRHSQTAQSIKRGSRLAGARASIGRMNPLVESLVVPAMSGSVSITSSGGKQSEPTLLKVGWGMAHGDESGLPMGTRNLKAAFSYS